MIEPPPRPMEVVWWPTLVVYKDGVEEWRPRVPNPLTLDAIKGLEKLLDERY
jgi:hypothetical protein